MNEEENQKRAKAIAEICSYQYQAFISEGLSQEDARVLTAAVILGSHLQQLFITQEAA